MGGQTIKWSKVVTDFGICADVHSSCNNHVPPSVGKATCKSHPQTKQTDEESEAGPTRRGVNSACGDTNLSVLWPPISSPTEQSVPESLSSLRFGSKVNACELGKPTRQIKGLHDDEEKGGGGGGRPSKSPPRTGTSSKPKTNTSKSRIRSLRR